MCWELDATHIESAMDAETRVISHFPITDEENIYRYITHGLGEQVEKVPKVQRRVGSIWKPSTFSIKESGYSVSLGYT